MGICLSVLRAPRHLPNVHVGTKRLPVAVTSRKCQKLCGGLYCLWEQAGTLPCTSSPMVTHCCGFYHRPPQFTQLDSHHGYSRLFLQACKHIPLTNHPCVSKLRITWGQRTCFWQRNTIHFNSLACILWEFGDQHESNVCLSPTVQWPGWTYKPLLGQYLRTYCSREQNQWNELICRICSEFTHPLVVRAYPVPVHAWLPPTPPFLVQGICWMSLQ